MEETARSNVIGGVAGDRVDHPNKNSRAHQGGIVCSTGTYKKGGTKKKKSATKTGGYEKKQKTQPPKLKTVTVLPKKSHGGYGKE